jgi:putative glycerol-1-phosphate prenyltransferase
MAVMQHILSAKNKSRKLLVLLLDPEKQTAVEALRPYLMLPDMIFVGGSTGVYVEDCIASLRPLTDCPIVLFPGNIAQFSPKADAILFLSLLNAKTADMLITPHIQIAQQVIDSRIESIPMGYILLNGGRKSSVEIVSNVVPIDQSDVDTVVSTAAAGQLLGKQLIYLEAGSGAKTPVSIEIIQAVSQRLTIPLIVGGGITTPERMLAAFEAGADVVVIGNHFEKNPNEIANFVRIKREKYG